MLASVPAFAQTTCTANCTLTVGQSYSVQADHDGVNTTGYRFILDGLQVGVDRPMTVLIGGVVTISGLTAPVRGTHLMQVVAFNEDGSTSSDPLSVSVKKLPPGKPAKTRIISAMTVTIGPVSGSE